MFCLVAGGCASSDTVLRKRVQMEGALEQLTNKEKALEAQVAELTHSLRDLQQRQKGTESDLDALRPGFDRLRASNDALYERLAELRPAAPAARVEQVQRREPEPEAAPPAAPPRAESAPAAKVVGQDAYARAFAVYSQGNYPAAIQAFENFAKAEPGSEFAPNALYWAGECHYAQHEYEAALKSFQRVVNEYPKARKVPDAMLKAGFALIGMKETARARGELQALVDRYPKSPAAGKAREKMGHL